MTDHKAESQRRAVIAKDTGDLVEAVLAVNEATLYLAEETHIANLLAFANTASNGTITDKAAMQAKVGDPIAEWVMR